MGGLIGNHSTRVPKVTKFLNQTVFYTAHAARMMIYTHVDSKTHYISRDSQSNDTFKIQRRKSVVKHEKHVRCSNFD